MSLHPVSGLYMRTTCDTCEHKAEIIEVETVHDEVIYTYYCVTCLVKKASGKEV